MRRRRGVSVLLLALLGGCSVTNTGNPHAPGGDAPDGIELVRSKLARETAPMLSDAQRAQFGSDSRQFAFDVYGKIKDRPGNLFFSPYSISTALAMTFAGAQSETEQEMASALRFSLGEPAVHAAFNATDLALQRRATELANPGFMGQGLRLELGNALFAAKGSVIVPTFLDTLGAHYDAGVYLADFARDPEAQRRAINDWVLDRTEQRIDELLPPDSITSDVAFVLVNAIYFKAAWLQKFDPALTGPATFHTPTGDVPVQMMHGRAEPYMRGEGYAAIELPYISDAVRVLFVLPDEGQLAAVEAKLDRALFDQTRVALGTHAVDLRIPRFKFEAEFKLKETLSQLGMMRAFAPGQADFSGLSGPPGVIYIDEVYHKAFVAMDEAGTEAAASTGVVPGKVSLPHPVTFTLDRPFLFFIHDVPTGQILFAGRVVSPSE